MRWRATEQIPADSVYKRRAKPRYDEARTLLVSEHMAVADKARTAGQCAEVRTEVRRSFASTRATRSRGGNGPSLPSA